MIAGQPGNTDVFVIETFTVVIKKESDGAYISEVIDLPGCTALAGSREELLIKTKDAIDAFLGR